MCLHQMQTIKPYGISEKIIRNWFTLNRDVYKYVSFISPKLLNSRSGDRTRAAKAPSHLIYLCFVLETIKMVTFLFQGHCNSWTAKIPPHKNRQRRVEILSIHDDCNYSAKMFRLYKFATITVKQGFVEDCSYKYWLSNFAFLRFILSLQFYAYSEYTF